MNNHSGYFIFFLFLCIAALSTIWMRNQDYYRESLSRRPFHPRFVQLKPSGTESHAYGIAGTVMIVVGVGSYSLRKRYRFLTEVGSVRAFLRFHILLCVLGPIFVMYHTTFKFGGIVAVSFWSMVAVVLSGVYGRYLFQHIPKNIEGSTLSVKEIDEQRNDLHAMLQSKYSMDGPVLAGLEAIDSDPEYQMELRFIPFMVHLIKIDAARFKRMRVMKAYLLRHGIDLVTAKEASKLANIRVVLNNRKIFLEKINQLFYFWHVVHVPCTIALFVILAIHICVAIVFGYLWIL